MRGKVAFEAFSIHACLLSLHSRPGLPFCSHTNMDLSTQLEHCQSVKQVLMHCMQHLAICHMSGTTRILLPMQSCWLLIYLCVSAATRCCRALVDLLAVQKPTQHACSGNMVTCILCGAYHLLARTQSGLCDTGPSISLAEVHLSHVTHHGLCRLQLPALPPRHLNGGGCH